MIKTVSALFLFSIAGVHCLNADVVYQFTVNTSSLDSDPANLDFQLNPGGLTSPAVTTVISGFMTDGSFTASDIALTGDAAGSLADEVTLNNTDGFNDAFQPIDLGTFVSFLATFSGPGIDAPGDEGTFFGFSIYDSAGDTALLTTSSDGTIAGLTADSFDGVEVFTNPATDGGPSAATVALVTPEPECFLLTGFGIAALTTIRRRAR